MKLANQAYSLGLSSVGQDVVVWPQAKIVSPEVISLGDSVIIDDFVLLMGGKKTTIGSFVHLASFVSVVGGGEFVMEDFAGISSGGRVYTGNDDYLGEYLTGPTIPFPYRVAARSFVHIKKHAIIGANTVILPGLVIGEGAAIGAGSVVTRDCEPWTIYVGLPARALRARPKERMLELEAQLRREIYDKRGQYLPKRIREGQGGVAQNKSS
jgi:acetyltransferase-like isoleucine patch superfamily enzyme